MTYMIYTTKNTSTITHVYFKLYKDNQQNIFVEHYVLAI